MVGSWLARRLVAYGATVVGLVADADPQSEFYRSGTANSVAIVNGRLERYDDVERAMNNHEVTSVLHLGAQPIVGAANRLPRHTFESNIQGTWNVLDAVRALSPMVERVVVASSDKAYGSQPNLPYVETMPLHGDHPYEVSKSCTDLISTTYSRTYSVPCTIARCGNIYGGGDLNWNRIVPGTFRALLRHETPVLRSDGTFVRDYIHVEDVVDAYLILAEESHRQELWGEGFNFSDESPLTVMEVYRAICHAAGRDGEVPRILGMASDEIKDQYLSSSKAQLMLDWRPRLSLDDGLRVTHEWYERFFDGAAL